MIEDHGAYVEEVDHPGCGLGAASHLEPPCLPTMSLAACYGEDALAQGPAAMMLSSHRGQRRGEQ